MVQAAGLGRRLARLDCCQSVLHSAAGRRCLHGMRLAMSDGGNFMGMNGGINAVGRGSELQ